MSQLREHVFGTPRHDEIKKQKRESMSQFRKSSIDPVKPFKDQIKEGPFYICVVCNRSLYRRSVILFKESSYSIDIPNFFFEIKSYDGFCYICLTCSKKIKKGDIPCQAVWNDLKLFVFPNEIANLNKLEKSLICKRMLFRKVTIMPKGQSPKVKGAICNIPVETDDVVNTLPRGADSNGLIMVKLKKKLIYRGHVFFEPVRPDIVQRVLEYLKENNPLYSDVTINTEGIPPELLSFENIPLTVDAHEEIPIYVEGPPEEVENPLDELRIGSNESVLTPKIPYQIDQESITIAPGEGKKPMSILTDKHCEELAYPYLFPTGKFGYKVKRVVALSATKYFNQRLLNYQQTFASDADYIFFAPFVTQQLNLNSRINIAMKKVSTNQLTAGMLSANFKDTVKSFIAKDEGYSFMNTVKGTPAYWQRFLFEVLAMVKQLGLPTFFLTLSCADLRWNELVSIISKLNGLNLSEEDIEALSYFDRCKILNSNPVLLARHFQYRVEVFFKEIVLDGPLGKVKYYVIRVEFQFRGSPHVHSFVWVVDAPILTKDTKDQYKLFIDQIVKVYLPDPSETPELHNLVETYQKHTHSRTCRKYKNKACRFGFGRLFTDQTIIADPLPAEMSNIERENKLSQRETILNKVKQYIDTELNPNKVNFLDQTKSDFKVLKNISEILNELELTESEYYEALSISSDNDFQIHFRHPPNSCFINNYFYEGLLAWNANLDIQPVINHYKAVTYMCAYFSKSEDETSEAMKQAAKDACNMNKNNFEQMKSIARAYTTKRECSVQEAVYHVMPELWLRKCSPGVLFANSNLPEHRYKMCLNEEEIKELPEDSTNIFKKNMIDRYMDRPNSQFAGGKYGAVAFICFADFLANYYLMPRPNVDLLNDNQPDILVEDLIQTATETSNFPAVLPLMSSKEKLKCRKTKVVLRYHVPNRNKYPERYAHHILFMFYPFRTEIDLSLNNSYMNKLYEPGVIDIVNTNKHKFEPYAELVDTALQNFRNDLIHNQDSFAQQENDEVNELITTTSNSLDDDLESEDEAVLFEDSHQDIPVISPPVMLDEDLNLKIQSLNKKQRKIFDVIHQWAREFVKNKSAKVPTKIDPLHIFITGKGGCGKSHLLKTVFFFTD